MTHSKRRSLLIYLDNLALILYIFYWGIFQNISTIFFGISLDRNILTSYLLLFMGPYVTGRLLYTHLSFRKILNSMAIICIALYLTFVDVFIGGGNPLDLNSYPLNYYGPMIYNYLLIPIVAVVLSENLDMEIFRNFFVKISLIEFLILYFVFTNPYKGVMRFANTNFTSFFVATIFIAILNDKKISKLYKLVNAIVTTTIIAFSAGRSSFLAFLLVTTFHYYISSRNKRKFIAYIFSFFIVYAVSYNIYWSFLVQYKYKYGAALRPLGFLFFDKFYISDLSSLGRIELAKEYINKIFQSPLYFFTGRGFISYSFYSHDIILDIIGFGGIIALVMFSVLILKALKVQNGFLRESLLFFLINLLFTGSIVLSAETVGLITLSLLYNQSKAKS